MSDQAVIDILREAFVVALRLAAPLLIVSLSVGLIISIFMAATQIQEMTLTFVPKLVIIGLTLMLLANWMITTLREFIVGHFQNILNFM
jgi:flagellar biosynthetic protein FliQ